MKCQREGNELVISFAEQMDTARCASVSKDVETEVAKAKQELGTVLKVKFDVSQVAFGSSSFLRICLSTAKSVGAASFSIVGANETLKKVFSIAGFDKILKVM